MLTFLVAKCHRSVAGGDFASWPATCWEKKILDGVQASRQTIRASIKIEQAGIYISDGKSKKSLNIRKKPSYYN